MSNDNPLVVARTDMENPGAPATVTDCNSVVQILRRLEGGEQKFILVNDPSSEQALVDAVSAIARHLQDHELTTWRVVGNCIDEGLRQALKAIDEVAARGDLERTRKSVFIDGLQPSNREDT